MDRRRASRSGAIAFQKSLSFATFSSDTVPAAAHQKMDAGEVFGRIVFVPSG